MRPITRLTTLRVDAPAPLGWEFLRDGRALGAVEQLDGGAVVLPRGEGDAVRRTLAAAAALVLFDDADVATGWAGGAG